MMMKLGRWDSFFLSAFTFETKGWADDELGERGLSYSLLFCLLSTRWGQMICEIWVPAAKMEETLAFNSG